MDQMFFVTRVFFRTSDGSQGNAIQKFDTETAARKRYYTLLAADIDNAEYSYEMVQIVRDAGVSIASQIFDNRIGE